MSLTTSLGDKFFKPASPLKSTGTSLGDGNGSAESANKDYRLDLTLQNLLSIGSEFAPDDIIALRKRARYGDPRWLYSLYDEMMRLGPAPQVLKAREAIKGTQTVWHATPDEADEDENSNDPADKTARLIRDVAEEAWDKWLPDLKTHLGTKYFYGIAACQVMWKPKAIEGKWSKVTDIRPIPARRFRLDPQTLRFKFLTNPYSWEGPFVDELQATGKLVFVEVGSDVDPLDQRGLLFQCLIPWAIEQFTVRWRAKRLQNFGMPPVMVTYPKGDPNNKAIADQLAEILASGTRASLPTDMKAELLAAPGAGSKGGDPYEANIEWCARQYDQIILGHSQVSGVQQGAGSRSSSKDAIGLFKDVTNSRAKELDVDIRQQCLYPFVTREFGPAWADDHCPEVRSAVVERDDPVELSTVALNLFNAGAAGAIAVEDLVERATLKVPEDGELTLAGNVKGDTPAPNEITAINKATPAALGEQAHVEVDASGKAIQKIRKVAPPLSGAAQGVGSDVPQPASPGTLAKGSKPGTPGAKPVKPPASAGASTTGGSFMTVGDFVPAARTALRKRRGRRAVMEFYTKRQRFAAAAFATAVGVKPRITLTSFGHEHGAPADTAMNLDVRSMAAQHPYDVAHTGSAYDVRAALEAHPATGAIYGGVKSRVQQAIAAGAVTGDHEMNLGIGCEHGKHRSVYVAERLAQELRNDGHDVSVVHRDADTASGPRGIAREQEFYSDEQERDDTGKWTSGGTASHAAENASNAAEHRAAATYHKEAAAYLRTQPHMGAPSVEHQKAARQHEVAAARHMGHAPDAAHASQWARGASGIAHAETKNAERSWHLRTGADDGAALRFTSIEPVGDAEAPAPSPAEARRVRASVAAQVAVRVRKRLKEQHAMAAAEAEHKLARAE